MMKDKELETRANTKSGGTFERAREIILKDTTIPTEEKEGILKLIQVLIEAQRPAEDAENDEQPRQRTDTQEVISRHFLLALVKQQADELDALKRLSLNLTSSLDLPTVLEAVVTEAMRLIKNARSAHIFLYTRGKLEFGAALHFDGALQRARAIPRRNGLTYTVARTGEQLVIEDMATHPLYQNAPPDWRGSIIGIPLKNNNVVVGVMNLSRSTVGGFTPSELRLISLLADQAAVAISNATMHKMVMEQANTDIVTGLPNRRALDERLEEEIRFARATDTPFAVVMMDLDGFKKVNDTYGHTIGDEVLRSVFNYLAGGIRATDFLARYGGDELTLILRQTDLHLARVVTEKILEKMREYRFVLPNGHVITLGVSGGVAVYPLHSNQGADLLRAADAALYTAKKHYRGTFIIAQRATGPLGKVSLAPLSE